MRRGTQSGTVVFVAPKVEGLYLIRLVHNETEELASTVFEVVS